MKKLRSLLLAAAMTVSLIPASAANAAGIQLFYDGADHLYNGSVYNLYVNGTEIRAAMEPIIFNDHALVPVREVFEEVGATVEYTGETRCVEIQYRKTYIRMYINDNCAYVNGKKTNIPDNVVPKLINKPGGLTKTMVPVRFISESAGMDVVFNGDEGAIYINENEPEPEPVKPPKPTEEPTPEPTEAPTPEPTEEPTEPPTERPTQAPAPAATARPTTAVVTSKPGSTTIYMPGATPKPTAKPAQTPTAAPKEAPAAEKSGAASQKVNPVSVYGAVPTMKGIDVSQHQKTIDWKTVANEIDFAIIRCGYGSDFKSQDDKYWASNVAACKKYGIPFGVYLYSYATNAEKAKSEAEHVLRLLKGVNVTLPVFYDLEDNSQKDLDAGTLGEMAQVFCDTVSAAGYDVGIYANKYWWTNYLTDPAFDNESWYRWVAQYNTSCTYKEDYLMWQYTGSGQLDGINGNVDMNFWYGSEYRD